MQKGNEILNEREKVSGHYPNVARMIQETKGLWATGLNWRRGKLTDAQVTSLEMIALKVTRILQGDNNHIDSWRDISGYAELAAIEIEKGEKALEGSLQKPAESPSLEQQRRWDIFVKREFSKNTKEGKVE